MRKSIAIGWVPIPLLVDRVDLLPKKYIPISQKKFSRAVACIFVIATIDLHSFVDFLHIQYEVRNAQPGLCSVSKLLTKTSGYTLHLLILCMLIVFHKAARYPGSIHVDPRGLFLSHYRCPGLYVAAASSSRGNHASSTICAVGSASCRFSLLPIACYHFKLEDTAFLHAGAS
ncbi:hypothetical protein BDZ91DRAFT_378826 [Kalaharituber pfeilii]|nr:hypothetical protein BDZ91DRAFT_378826 [Kalaharituber pfeilii]